MILIYGYESYDAWVEEGCPGAAKAAAKSVYTDWAEVQCEDCGSYRDNASYPCRTCAYRRPARYPVYRSYARRVR